MKKFILLLFALFSLSFLSGYANAVCPSGMEGGDTASNPCLITNCSQLQNMSQDLSGNFALVNDIDCSETASWNSGLGFLPVGNSGSNFYGTFDGRGYSISNLYINRTSSSNIGLFGYVSSNKLICNVHLVDVNITGFYDVGGLVGYANTVKIDNCSVSGKIRGTITGDADGYIGGLIGVVYDAGYIINSYADVSVSAEGRFVGC